MHYKNGCITLNRDCNLRCKWCYAEGTGYHPQDTMPLKMAKDILDLCKSLQFRHVKLLGGEPTLYPDLFELLAYAGKEQIRTGFLTNGVLLSDKSFTRALIAHGIDHISVSLKGCSEEEFRNTTGRDAFGTVLAGIENCLSLGASVVAFLVLSNESLPCLTALARSLRGMGVRKFRFTFVYHLDTSPGYKGYLEKAQPYRLVQGFRAIYDELDRITEHNIGIFPTFPACFWGIDFIRMLHAKGQLVRGCTLKDRTDLIFDSRGCLIPCSAMYRVKFGQLYKDFTTAEELAAFCDAGKAGAVYDACYRAPSAACGDCEAAPLCDCCSCQWTNYTFAQLLQTREGGGK